MMVDHCECGAWESVAQLQDESERDDHKDDREDHHHDPKRSGCRIGLNGWDPVAPANRVDSASKNRNRSCKIGQQLSRFMPYRVDCQKCTHAHGIHDNGQRHPFERGHLARNRDPQQ